MKFCLPRPFAHSFTFNEIPGSACAKYTFHFVVPCAGQVLQPRGHRAGGAAAAAGAEEVGGSAAARVTVVAPLPLLLATVETPDCTVVPPPAPVEVRPMI